MERDGAGVLGRSQLGRLLQVLLALRSEASPNARQLAELCEVSTRTIYRDLATLSLSGVGVWYSAERRGYVLGPGYELAPPRLLDEEVQALIVLVLEGIRSGRAPGAATGRRALLKLVESLPDVQRTGARRLLDRTTAEADDASSSPGVLSVLLEAVWRRVEVVVHGPGRTGGASERLAPYHLHADRAGAWYVVGRFGAGPAVRSVALTRLERVELTDQPFVLPATFDARVALARSRGVHHGPEAAAGWGPNAVAVRVGSGASSS
jgi:predicted DNA-binding transcriptional regulator YafY